MSAALPPVWFERYPVPEAAAEVDAAVELLGPGESTPDDPYQAMTHAIAAVAGSYVYDAAVMERGPLLQVISRTGIGVDTVDVAAATERGIGVCNAPDGPTISTAEHAVALMLAAAKRLKASAAALAAGGDNIYAQHRGVELDGKTLGLVGYGRIARRVARIATGLGMVVRAHDPHLDPSAFVGAEHVAHLGGVLDAHVVSVHVPLTEETRGMFDAASFVAMKPGAIFVNTARGGLVDQAALLAALDGGHRSAAALDVTDPEPLPADHPLLRRDDVIVTPHVASATADGKARIFRIAFRQVLQVIGGERPDHLVNPDVWVPA